MTLLGAPTAIQPPPHFDRIRVSVTMLCTALGIACVAGADVASRSGYSVAYALFWLALLLIFVPIAFGVLRKDADRRERLLFVVVLGIALYLVKVLFSPDAFAFTDEFIHLRNTQDVLATGHLFAYNPLLPTAAYYPGLAAVTAGFVDLTGLSPFASGIVMIGAARLLFCLCLFLIAERVTGSSRGAAAASLIYIANPMFLFWGASFAYEDLALPLAAFVVWWLGLTRREAGRSAQIVTVIAIVAVCVTHHVVGFALTALLGAWWLAEGLTQRGVSAPRDAVRAARITLEFMAVFAGAMTLTWLFLVARPAPTYLFTDNILPALQQTVSVLLGWTPMRQLYTSGGYASPTWEIVAGAAAVFLLLLALPAAAYRAWHRRDRAPMLVAIGVAAAYPLSLAARLAPIGVAISGRSSEYVFAGLACGVGLLAGATLSWGRNHREDGPPGAKFLGRHLTAVAAGLVTVVFVGNVTIGTAFYQRLPEAATPTGYPWSVQPDVISASEWALAHLGIHQPFGANAIDASALATYGEQNPVAQNDVWPIFFAGTTNEAVVNAIRVTGVRYLLVDWRMTDGVPATPGYYFSPYEPHAGEYTQAFPPAALRKFASDTCSRLVYDSGPLEIFDVSAIENGSCSPGIAEVARNGVTPA